MWYLTTERFRDLKNGWKSLRMFWPLAWQRTTAARHYFQPLPLSLFFFLSFFLSLFLSLSLTHTLSLSHTHTHTLSLSLSLSLSLHPQLWVNGKKVNPRIHSTPLPPTHKNVSPIFVSLSLPFDVSNMFRWSVVNDVTSHTFSSFIF